jgi:hypothetical protein
MDHKSESLKAMGDEPVDVGLTTSSFGPEAFDQAAGVPLRPRERPSHADGSIDHDHRLFAAGSTKGWSGGIPGGSSDPEMSVEIWAYSRLLECFENFTVYQRFSNTVQTMYGCG